MSFLRFITQTRTLCPRGGSAEQDNPSPHMVVAVLGLWHPREQLALWVVRARCWLAFNLLLCKTPRFPSAGLISSLSAPSLYMPRAAPSQVQNPVLLMENSLQLVIAQLSNLSKSHFKASLPSRESTAPSQFRVVCKCTWYTLKSWIQVMDKSIEENWSQNGRCFLV